MPATFGPKPNKNKMTKHIILKFIRQKEDGAVELVTWFKNHREDRHSEKRPYYANEDEIKRLEATPNKQIILFINQKEYPR